MPSKIQPINKKIFPVKLYQEDIFEIYEIIGELKKSNTLNLVTHLHIEIDEYELKSLEEMKDLKIKKTTHLSFKDFTYEYLVSVTESGVWIISNSSVPICFSVTAKLEEFFKSKRRLFIFRKSIIYLDPKENNKSFFERKKDDVLMAFIGFIFGIVSTLIVQFILKFM